MNYTFISNVIKDLSMPAFITDLKGNLINENKYMRLLFPKTPIQYKGIVCQNDFIQLDTDDPTVKYVEVKGSRIVGKKHLVDNCDGRKFYLYIFNKNINTDVVINDVMEHIDEIIVIFDKHGNLEKMNSLCDQLLPFKRDDVIGKNINVLVDMGFVDEPIITQMIKEKKKIYRDIKYPNGKIISYTAIPLFEIDGGLKGGVLTGRDVSRLVNLAKLSASKKEEAVEYISVSKKLDKIKKIITAVAPSEASVMIIGESGVGKEIIAKSVWSQSDRSDKPFVAINCASIPRDLIESELFGYVKGAFTGASPNGKIGLIEAADKGTLFLDEIGELPLETQKKLLRAIQERSVMRIGDVKPKRVNVRFICATNKTAAQLNDPRIFRQDLYYRLGVVPIVVPPLRQRKEDIVPICEYYLEIFNEKYSRNVILHKDAINVLLENEWRGNIRELKNVMERLVILSAQDNIHADQMKRMIRIDSLNGIELFDDEITSDDSDFTDDAGEGCQESSRGGLRGMSSGNAAYEDDDSDYDEDTHQDAGPRIVIKNIMPIDDAHRIVEQEIIRAAVKQCGNITAAADLIGMNPSTIYRKIKSGYISLEE